MGLRCFALALVSPPYVSLIKLICRQTENGKIMTEKFQGTENYIATEDLRIAVNAALTLSVRC